MADTEERVTVEYKPGGGVEDGVLIVGSPTASALAPITQRRNSRIPILFERAAKSWWDPKFDSTILEEEHSKISLPQTRRRFQYALCYIMVSCISWSVFFGLLHEGPFWVHYIVATLVLCVITAVVFAFTFSTAYKRFVLPTSVIISLALCIFGLLNYVYPGISHVSGKNQGFPISAVGTFTGSIEILLMMYTVIPLPLYLCVVLGIIYSILFEVLSGLLTEMDDSYFIISRALLHFCIHMIGIHIFIMSQVRKRSTFLKVGQSIMSRKDLEIEKQLKNQMIHSLMPPQVAMEVIQSRGKEDKKDEDDYSSKQRRNSGPPEKSFNFRSFHMTQMDNVSILFADIVGFTKMSSNKTAEHLVSLLNDLFGRFDILCTKCGCEKICTLGDCYYCVSGCPTYKEDHAKCCVEMGLAMCKAIEEFDSDHNEEVDMRVGVHTGMVLCGIVGTRRFKFDVWSHDVNLANIMESSGQPGKVHISDATYNFVKDEYEVEPGDDEQDIRNKKVLTECFDPETQQYIVKHQEETNVLKTWFIVRHRNVTETTEPQPADGCLTEEKPVDTEIVKISLDDEKSPEQVDTAKEISESNLDSAEKSHSNHLDTSQLHPDNNNQHIACQPTYQLDVCPSNLHADCDPSFSYKSDKFNDCCSYGSDPVLILENGALFVHPSEEMRLLATSIIDTSGQSLPQGDGNEVSTASLLGKRENLDDVENDSKADGDTALMNAIHETRAHELTDKQLTSHMESDLARTIEYLYRPPINQCTLKFHEDRLEKKYHRHYVEDKDVIRTLALPKFSALCDMIVSFIFFIIISVCCFLRFKPICTPLIIVFAIALLLEFLMLFPLVCMTCSMQFPLGKFSRFFSNWYVRHFFGCVIASLPSMAVYANYCCMDRDEHLFYSILLIASLLHYCNFTMLSSWMKSSVATVAGVILLVLLGLHVVCTSSDELTYNISSNSNITVSPINITDQDIYTKSMQFEPILNIILFLLLVWFLNREFEISYRLCFHGDQQALHDRKNMQIEKEQADWLLHNIIPEHVADIVKKTCKYCQNHKDVGVIFASVTNFDSFYDESFQGGKEYLRVLNELMGDFEELFDDPKYKDIEKIKTIGSCLMASAGLNPQTRKQNSDPNSHLYALIDFCIDILERLDQFNADLLNFDFKMKIGFNFGEVTSGVIGTTKLLYDIWGDTVNIASRMYSTGVEGRIQLPQTAMQKLGEKFEFEYRGEIKVKGKGDMKTYLLVRKKPGATWK